MSSNLESNMRKTTEALVLSFHGPKWSLEASLAPRAPNCEHIMLPPSQDIPKKSNDEWASTFKHIEPLITDATMTIDEYIADPSQRRAVCRSSLTATTPVGPYANDYVWFLTFDESGEKIVRIEEFMDTKAAADIRRRLGEGGFTRAHSAAPTKLD